MRIAESDDGLDWRDYWQGLNEDGAGALARWLVDQQLQVGEFMEVVDRAYASVPTVRRGRARFFVAQIGRPMAELYARRKHLFGGLMLAYQEALLSGAQPVDVAPHQLRPGQVPPPRVRPVVDIVAAIERARRAAR